MDNVQYYAKEGRYAKYENNVEALVDSNEAESLFKDLSAWDLELLSIPAWGADYSTVPGWAEWNLDRPSLGWDDTSRSVRSRSEFTINMSQLDAVSFDGEALPYILYCIKYTYNLQLGNQINKSTGFLIKDNKVVKVISPSDFTDAEYKDEAFRFNKMTNENIEVRLLPIGQKSFKLRTYYYYFPPTYYFTLAATNKVCGLFGAGIITKVFFGRVLSAILGVLTLLFLYKSLERVFNDHQKNMLGGLIIFAFWPMNTFMYSVLNSEALFNFFSAAAFYYLLSILFSKEHSKRDWVLFSIISSLAAFTKVTGALFVIIWWVPLIALLVIHRKEKIKAIFFLPPLMQFLGPFLMWHRTHRVFVAGGSQADLSMVEYLQRYLSGGFMWFYRSFAGNFGSLRDPMPDYIYTILILLTITVLVLFFCHISKGFEKHDRIDFIYLFLCTVTSIIFFFFIEWMKFKESGSFIQGRYLLFLAVPMITIVYSIKSLSLEKFKNIGETVFNLFVVSIMLINGIALYHYVMQNFS